MSLKYRWTLLSRVGLLMGMLLAAVPAQAQSLSPEVRIKELAHVQGVSINNLVGYGVVVGLAGTGDQTVGGGLTSVSMSNMLEKLGIMIAPDQIRAKNVAVVLVTASMPPYSKSGDNMDVTVSSIGDARSLQGGQLVQTRLMGADNKVYALAQGPVTIGGIGDGGGGGLLGGLSSFHNHTLAGRVPNGGLLVRDVPAYASADNGDLTITLNEPDATTASKMAQTIRSSGLSAEAVNPSTIRVQVPPSSAFSGNRVDLVAKIEQLSLRPDHVAKVVINERTGTVVMGGDVKLGPVAIAHGNLRLVIQSPTAAFGARGNGTNYAAGGIGRGAGGYKEQSVLALGLGATLRDVTDALNNIGVTPRDLIAIVQALKSAGALDAEVEMQ